MPNTFQNIKLHLSCLKDVQNLPVHVAANVNTQ